MAEGRIIAVETTHIKATSNLSQGFSGALTKLLHPPNYCVVTKLLHPPNYCVVTKLLHPPSWQSGVTSPHVSFLNHPSLKNRVLNWAEKCAHERYLT
ncbi:hypothetical protein TNCV_3025981 [Trichonephila clavipes]|nr:hypothetical protein TNCV_3025981 [Trichonephila clavipes]